MTTKHEVEREAQRLQRIVAEAVAEPETADLAGITAVLHQTTAQVQALRRAAARGEAVTVPADRLHAYFPPRSAAPTAGELHVADARWQAALERGRRYRAEAQAQVGPLLTPAETAQRLGVSPVTVNRWRRQDRWCPAWVVVGDVVGLITVTMAADDSAQGRGHAAVVSHHPSQPHSAQDPTSSPIEAGGR
jgi:hypothetical protein